MYSEAAPLEPPIEAMRHTAQTYGMDYPELFARARSDFFSDHVTSDPGHRGPGDS
ncbi:hypothetical protein [Rhodococcus sp. BUPNP1]|uniref:hypothetical protein n=1 Tax=Rhodococcus sp. BUPNP1 TaxID=1432786 RepID=UPI001C0F0757|nr:hypothetical protein [Rhodococcus sp. BUPNP1]